MKLKNINIIILMFFLTFTSCEVFNLIDSNKSDNDNKQNNLLDISEVKLTPESGTTTIQTKPTLKWDSLNNSVQHHIQISMNQDFSGQNILENSTLTENTYTTEKGIHEGSYYWRIKQMDKNGEWSNWSLVSNFIINMFNPVNGTPSNNKKISETSVTLTWDKITGAIEYKLEVNTSKDFNNASTKVSETLKTSSYTITITNPFTNYFWRVKQKDNNGAWSNWSETFSFRNYNTVGEIGPSGGYIFYDDEADGIDNILGYRFLEVAPEDLQEQKVWGSVYDPTGRAIGAGIQNTDYLLKHAFSASDAAQACVNYSLENNGIMYDDWFLPSIEELNEIYNTIKVNNITSFYYGLYWSSSSDPQPWSLDFTNRIQGSWSI